MSEIFIFYKNKYLLMTNGRSVWQWCGILESVRLLATYGLPAYAGSGEIFYFASSGMGEVWARCLPSGVVSCGNMRVAVNAADIFLIQNNWSIVMTNPTPVATISVFDVVGSHICVASTDGAKVYRLLSRAIARAKKEKRKVVLSFRNVEILMPAFVGGVMWRLYKKYSEAEVRRLVQVEDMREEDAYMIESVARKAKFYYEDPAHYRRVWKNILEGNY